MHPFSLHEVSSDQLANSSLSVLQTLTVFIVDTIETGL